LLPHNGCMGKALQEDLILSATNFTHSLVVVCNFLNKDDGVVAKLTSMVLGCMRRPQCYIVNIPFLYLGLPIGGDPRKLVFWYSLVDRIKRRLSDWNSRNLSLGGRLILLKSIMSSIPVYFLSFFKAPSGIISILESLCNAFFWEDVRMLGKLLG